MKQVSFIIFIFLSAFYFSCKKETIITSKNARLEISADTLRFDTLFTTTGSVTQYFIIKNDNDQRLVLDNVSIKGGTGSPFKINVDGIKGPDVRNIEIGANDSIYVFVTASINQNTDSLPFVSRDSIEIKFNGNERYVQLETWAQNANFMRQKTITGNVTWTSNLPYVILGGIRIESNATLTIEKGCRIYLHADAPFIVDGSLKVNGEKYDSTRVYFRGDRLDIPFKEYPAGWPGIFFTGSSKDNILNFAVIQNAYQGIVAENVSINANPRVILNECIIDNIYDAGILGIQTSIQARNCLVSNCGKNIQLVYGGNYQFVHCTVASINNPYIEHKEPVLLISNFAKQGNTIITSDLNAVFRNCIFWGDGGKVDDEVVTSRQGSNVYSVNFENCLWKVKATPANVSASNMLVNKNPAFDSINTEKHFFNFRLKDTSAAINNGINTGVTFDLDGKIRPIGLPDLGSYEKQ